MPVMHWLPKRSAEVGAVGSSSVACVDSQPGGLPLPPACPAGMPGRPVSEAERAAWLAERERRTAVHPRRKW